MLEYYAVEISIFIFIFGLMLGSFLNVVIYRIPLGESIILPSSHCPSCQTPLKIWHNIPLFSWLVLKGKCAFCHTTISKQYPLIEIFTAIIFLVLFIKLGLVWYFPFVALSFSMLLALIVIDIEYLAVPDSINITALLFALIHPEFLTFGLNALLAAGGLALLGLISSLLARRQAMGSADIIVAGTMGALLGFPLFFIALFMTAVIALIPAMYNRYRGDDKGIPFIPFLALSTFICYINDIALLNLLGRLIYE